MYLAAVFPVGMDFSAAILRALNLKNGGSSACQVSSPILGFLPQGHCSAKGNGVRPITLHRGLFPNALIALLFLGAHPLWAQSEVESIGITVPSIATSLPYYGDFYGDRKWLNDRGVTY